MCALVQRRLDHEHILDCYLYVQVAIPQLIPGGQFPYFATGQPIPGYYIPQTIATQSPYLQAGLPGYPFSSFGASYPQGYFG